MKKKLNYFKTFSKTLGKGMYVEWKETKEIPKLLKNKEFKKAADQVTDIVKMVGLGVVWIVPGGAVITTVILKFSHKIRPSAFQTESNKRDSSFSVEKRSKKPEKDI